MSLRTSWMLPVGLLLVVGTLGCGVKRSPKETAIAVIEKLGGTVKYDEENPERPGLPLVSRCQGIRYSNSRFVSCASGERKGRPTALYRAVLRGGAVSYLAGVIEHQDVAGDVVAEWSVRNGTVADAGTAIQPRVNATQGNGVHYVEPFFRQCVRLEPHWQVPETFPLGFDF